MDPRFRGDEREEGKASLLFGIAVATSARTFPKMIHTARLARVHRLRAWMRKR